MSAPTSGLARVTIRAPRRRLDLSVPHQVPLAELLPEVLRRAGELIPGQAGSVPAGWTLRRGDGALLNGGAALAPQGVRDGDVLYLVPRDLSWPEPAYDDVVEEIAAGARSRGRAWDAAATRVFALVAAGLLVMVGLGLLVTGRPGGGAGGLVAAGVATVLLVTGALLSRAVGDGVAGATAAGLALPYAAAAGVLLAAAGTAPGAATAADSGTGAARVLVGAGALLFAAVVGSVAVGDGLRVFVAAGTAGVLAAIGALAGLALPAAGAAAIVCVALVAGIGVAPLLAVRLGRLPLPVVTAAPDVLAAERLPERAAVLGAVARADDILAGMLLGIAVSYLGCAVVLAGGAGPAASAGTNAPAGIVLAVLAAGALLLRSRLFPGLAARLPLLVGGTVGLAIVAWTALAGGGVAATLVGVGVAIGAVLALLGGAATGHRRRAGGSAYLGRFADILDLTAVVALAPVACAVLNLYGWVRGLAG